MSMKVGQLRGVLDRCNPDANIIFDSVEGDDDGDFFDITETEWRRMAHITWVDGTSSWWPPEQVTDEARVDIHDIAEHFVLVLR